MPDIPFKSRLISAVMNGAKLDQAVSNGEVHYCNNCKKVQPIELTFFNPDQDSEPSLIVCLVCKESIGFIENL